MNSPLTKKEFSLQETVALPDHTDWQLLGSEKLNAMLIGKLNNHLTKVLEKLKLRGVFRTWGEIKKEIYRVVDALSYEYPEAGITDSEGRLTVARFFAVNYDPAIFDYLRY